MLKLMALGSGTVFVSGTLLKVRLSPRNGCRYDPPRLNRKFEKLLARLDSLDRALAEQSALLSDLASSTIKNWQIDSASLKFHLSQDENYKPITVVVGGTGTGKSTLVNRLVGSTVTAASFRRTFTTGPVAVVQHETDLPAEWLGVEHIGAVAGQPPRGQTGSLVTVADTHSPGTLVDTPDLDGDQPANHAQADRAFRWAHRIIFVVTPEKYQMTELLPYYRLASRYQLPALFVMNKCDEPAVLDDFLRQLGDRNWPDAHVFAVPRDDAGYEPPVDENLDALRAHLLKPIEPESGKGIDNRVADVVARLTDQVIGPLREARRNIDQICASLHAMENPVVGVDVNPITEELRRRMQQRSVLYLVGPSRVIDRVRQMPTLLARLPRATWDWVVKGHAPIDLIDPRTGGDPNQPPDFTSTVADQFTIVRSRVDDAVRSNAPAAKWIAEDSEAYQQAMIEPATAGLIATEEIAQLKVWLEKRWNATPRDTRMLQALLKHLPGGAKLAKWSEAAPYLMMAVLIAHHALFWHIDLPVLGGYTLITWVTEKLSNEVSGRTRTTNRRIGERFEKLSHDQIQKICAWLDRQAPSKRELEKLENLAADLMEAREK